MYVVLTVRSSITHYKNIIKKYDCMCLSETKYNIIADIEIVEYKPFIMQNKYKSHRFGGIHGFVFSLNPTELNSVLC